MATLARAVGSAFSLGLLLLTTGARAQDSATAGALFEKGVADMEAGQFATACPAIEESQRVDPRPGTLFTLAECHAGWGKVASATAQYQEYVDLVSRLTREQQIRHLARVDIARAQLAKLKPQVPTLTLEMPAQAPPGTFVTRNGELLKSAALGLPLPVDPGDYVITTHLPGGLERETEVALKLGEAKRLLLELPSPATKTESTPARVPTRASVDATPTPAAARPEARSSARRTATLGATGVGVAGIAVGSVAGILVFSKKHEVTANCAGTSCRNDTGLAAAKSGQNLALVSDIGFGVGVAGLAVGAILWLTGGSEATAREPEHAGNWQPLLFVGQSGLATGLSGRW